MTTVLIAVFAWSVAEEARQRAEALTATQLALAREQQLSALGGQAAAAAHLLGTPLGTINIIAKELVRELPDGSPLAEEAAELLAQAKRCRELLAGLGRRGDERRPPALHPRTVHEPARAHRGRLRAPRGRGAGAAGAGRRRARAERGADRRAAPLAWPT